MNEVEKSAIELQLAISQRIRDLRLLKSWSLERLAQETGLSKGYLSQIENRYKAPSIGTLSNIAFSLGTDVHSLITGDKEEEREKRLAITKTNDRRAIKDPRMPSVNRYESVTYKMPDGMLDAYVIILGREVPKNYNPHEGEELIFALEGQSEFTYDGQVFILEPGDCVYYHAKRAHNIRAHTMPAKVLSVLLRHRF